MGATAGKELGTANFAKIPNGCPGIENRMGVMWHHGVGGQTLYSQPICRIDEHQSCQDFWTLPAKGYNRCRFGCRHCDLGSQEETDNQRSHPPHEYRLFTLSKG